MERLGERDEMETSSTLLNYSASSCLTEVIRTESTSLNILLEDSEEMNRKLVSMVQVESALASGSSHQCHLAGGSSHPRHLASGSSHPRHLAGGSSHPRHLLIPCESSILHLSPDRPIFLRRNLRGRSSPIVDIAEKIKKIIIQAGPEVLIPGTIGIIRSGKGMTRHHLETILEEPIRQNGELITFSGWKPPRSLSAKYQWRRAKFRAQIQRRLITEAKVKDISKQFLNMGL